MLVNNSLFSSLFFQFSIHDQLLLPQSCSSTLSLFLGRTFLGENKAQGTFAGVFQSDGVITQSHTSVSSVSLGPLENYESL